MVPGRESLFPTPDVSFLVGGVPFWTYSSLYSLDPGEWFIRLILLGEINWTCVTYPSSFPSAEPSTFLQEAGVLFPLNTERAVFQGPAYLCLGEQLCLILGLSHWAMSCQLACIDNKGFILASLCPSFVLFINCSDLRWRNLLFIGPFQRPQKDWLFFNHIHPALGLVSEV